MKPSPKRSCCRRASITRASLLSGRRPRFLFLLPLLSQLFSVQGGEGTPNLPKGGPGLLCPAGGFGMLRRNVQRAALAIHRISNVEVWPVEVLGRYHSRSLNRRAAKPSAPPPSIRLAAT